MRWHQTSVLKTIRQLTLLAFLLTIAVCHCSTTFGQGLISPTPAEAFDNNLSPIIAPEVPEIPDGFGEQPIDFATNRPIQLLAPEFESIVTTDTPQYSDDSGLIAPYNQQAPVMNSPPAASSIQPPLFSFVAPTALQRYGYATPVRANFFGGETYAEPAAFLALDILRPVGNQFYKDGSELLQYFDGRLGLSTAGGGVIGNLGFGQRYYMPSVDSIADLNIWYDVDSTRGRVFQQVTGGGQIQNQNLLLRGHYYLPVGTTEKVMGTTVLTGNSSFIGNNLALERFRDEEQAFHGYDVEAGLLLPVDNFMARWFVGYYNFEAKTAAPLAGYSSTINFDPTPNLTVGVQFTYDEETHDTGYMFSVSYDFYQGPRDPAPNIRHRMGESVRRNRHIVSRRRSLFDPEMATDVDGNLLNFVHVSSAGNSDGTVESPYANLSQAAADALAQPNSIIFAHAGSVFDGQSIVLPANTRFLGEGAEHSVVTSATQLGTIVLPRATAGATLPVIRNSPGTSPAITMANTTEVSGFRIENAGGAAIFGSGLTGQNSIMNTTVDGATTGLHLLGNASTLSVQGLSINNTTGSGIWIESATGGSAITFNDALSVTNAGTHGIRFDRNSDNSSTTFTGAVAIANTGTHGIFFDDNGENAAVRFSSAVSVANTGGSGVVASNLDTAAGTAGSGITFADSLTISNTAQSGLVSNLNASNLTIPTLAISNWRASAISIDGSSGNLTVTNPVVLNNINGSTAPTLQVANSSGATTFGDVTITDTSRTVLGQPTVYLFQNNTGVNAISFNALNVTSNRGIALFGQDAGTISKLIIRSGTISSTGSTAVSLNTLSTDITLQSVSASNTAVGVSLVNVGATSAFHDRFQIVGNSIAAGSGGVMTNVGTGVLVDGTSDVSLHLMNIDSTTTGVLARANGFNQPADLTVNQLTLTNAAATANWIGIDVDWNNGAHTSGANVFSNNTIASSGSNQIGLRIDNNQSNPAMRATIGGNAINLTGLNATGISLNAQGVTPLQTTNIGGIGLTTSLNNIVNAPANPFIATSGNGATITGQILVNDVLRP